MDWLTIIGIVMVWLIASVFAIGIVSVGAQADDYDSDLIQMHHEATRKSL